MTGFEPVEQDHSLNIQPRSTGYEPVEQDPLKLPIDSFQANEPNQMADQVAGPDFCCKTHTYSNELNQMAANQAHQKGDEMSETQVKASYHTTPSRPVPYPTLPYLTLPYPTLPYPTLPYPTLPYPTTLHNS